MDMPRAKILANPRARLVKELDFGHSELRTWTMTCNMAAVTTIGVGTNNYTNLREGEAADQCLSVTHFLHSRREDRVTPSEQK